jgi:hypothetical protein
VALFPLAAASPGGFEAPAAAPQPVLQTASATPPPPELQWTVDEKPSDDPGSVSVPLPSSDLSLNVRVPDAPVPAAPSAPAPKRFPNFGPPDEPALSALIRLTQDRDPDVRRSAVAALGQMDGGPVVGSLVRSMSDTDARVRSAAAMALDQYAYRQNAARVAAKPCEGAECEPRPRVPTGSAAPAPRPRNARTDMDDGGGGGGGADPALRILGGLMEEDTLAHRSANPDEMIH